MDASGGGISDSSLITAGEYQIARDSAALFISPSTCVADSISPSYALAGFVSLFEK